MQTMQLEQPIQRYSVWDDFVPIVQSDRSYDVFLSEEIESPSEYNKLCYLLDRANIGDKFYLHLNTPGGMIDSAVKIINSINTTNAKVTACLTGTVASAGTLIALSCHHLRIAPHTKFMIHNYSGGAGGKGHEIKAMVEFSDKELNKTFKKIYSGFLTDEEMNSVIEGRDIWLNATEVEKRWINLTNPTPEVPLQEKLDAKN